MTISQQQAITWLWAIRDQILDAEDFVAQMVKLLTQSDDSPGREHAAS